MKLYFRLPEMVERTSYFNQIGGLAWSPLLTGNTLMMFPISSIDFLKCTRFPRFWPQCDLLNNRCKPTIPVKTITSVNKNLYKLL